MLTQKKDYVSLTILKSDYYKIQTAFNYAISSHKAQAASFKRSTGVDSVSKKIAKDLEEAYNRIYD